LSHTCGDCGLCCKLLAIRELEKPRGTMCGHFHGAGCGIYADRPPPCGAFRCAWLINETLGPEWHPLTAGFFVWFERAARRMVIEADPDAPGAWRADPYFGAIKAWSRRDRFAPGEEPWEVVVRTGLDLTVIFPETEIALGPERGSGIASGYEVIAGRPRPFARFVE
jgi:hypothetical protein